jgi:dynein heavy chain
LETETWEKIVPVNNPPEARGGHSVFASEGKVYIYGGWNNEMQFNKVEVFDLEKKEWSDPDVDNGIHRWNHSSVLVEAIPTWKFFIFGGECAEYNEGAPRSFGQYVNSSCYLDLGTIQWTTYASDQEVFENMPAPREYAAMAYDKRESKLLIYGGWNNGWFNDLYSLNVGKIVGPSYAITASEPNLGQLSGNVTLKITGQGFTDGANIQVLFTCGNRPVDAATKMTLTTQGTYVSETELTCVTPSFEQFGPKECVVQLSIGGNDFTTTWIPFHYFLNTRALKSLAYGPGLLQDVCAGQEVEFIIQARNDLCENRQSGRDEFEVKVMKQVGVIEEEAPAEGEEVPEGEEAPKKAPKAQLEEIPSYITDNDNGTYTVKYTVPDEIEVEIHINFRDDKDRMVPIRGSPYKASFTSKAKATDNTITGGAMEKHIKKECERLLNSLTECKKASITKDKDLKDVKSLL